MDIANNTLPSQTQENITHQPSRGLMFVVVLIFFLIGIGLYQLKKYNDRKNEFQLQGSEVIRKINGHTMTLFKNVSGVTQLKLGPDGITLHFKPSDRANENQQYCANLEEKDRPATEDYPDYPNPPPNQPPWDFERIAHAYTIRGCDGAGFLKNSNYFVYLQLRTNEDGYLIYEDLSSGEKKEVKVSSTLLSGFSDGSAEKQTSYWVAGVQGKDGYRYYYPRQDALAGSKLLLSFGRLVLAVDPVHNQFLGGKGFSYKDDQDYPIVASSYYFIHENTSPFVVLEGRWEGPGTLIGVVDLSGNTFKLTKLAHLDRRPWFNFGVKVIEWQNDAVLLNFTDIENVKIPEGFLAGKDIMTMEDAALNVLADQLEVKLNERSKYKKIICDLHPGMVTPGCEGLKSVNHYRYTAAEGLVKE